MQSREKKKTQKVDLPRMGSQIWSLSVVKKNPGEISAVRFSRQLLKHTEKMVSHITNLSYDLYQDYTPT